MSMCVWEWERGISKYIIIRYIIYLYIIYYIYPSEPIQVLMPTHIFHYIYFIYFRLFSSVQNIADWNNNYIGDICFSCCSLTKEFILFILEKYQSSVDFFFFWTCTLLNLRTKQLTDCKINGGDIKGLLSKEHNMKKWKT